MLSFDIVIVGGGAGSLVLQSELINFDVARRICDSCSPADQGRVTIIGEGPKIIVIPLSEPLQTV